MNYSIRTHGRTRRNRRYGWFTAFQMHGRGNYRFGLVRGAVLRAALYTWELQGNRDRIIVEDEGGS